MLMTPNRMAAKIATYPRFLLLFAFLSLGFSSVAHAELKVAVLDTQRAIVGSEEAQGLIAQLEQEFKAKESDVGTLRDEIVALNERLQKDGEVMSDAEKRRVGKEIEDKRIDYQFQVNKLQKELNDRQQELFRELVPKVDAVLKDLIELEGYDMVMERSTLRWVNSKHDITRKVTEKLNERSKGSSKKKR